MKKDQSGYFRLDLKPSGKDYKSYLEEQAQKQGISVTKYIHKLIENDMLLHSQKPKDLENIASKFSQLSEANQQLVLDLLYAIGEAKKK